MRRTGELLNRPATDGPGFTGHVQDTATGMTYMQQRYYDSGIGRFLSVDPVTANSGTGGNFNRYWYANNNPYKFTDPDGRQASICEETPQRCKAVIPVNPSSGSTGNAGARTATGAQRTAIGTMSYRSTRTGSEGIESKFYMDDSGEVLGKSQSGCYGQDRCTITRSELPDGTTLAGHLHVYPNRMGSARLPEAVRLSREFPGPGDARPLSLGLVSAVIMPSGARYLIEGTAASPTISYLGGGDAALGAYVQRTWQPEMTDKQIMDSVKSYLKAGP